MFNFGKSINIMNTKYKLFFTLIFCFWVADVFTQNWVFEFEKDGVKVWTRKLDWSSIKECKGETIINTNLGSVAYVLDDVDNYPRWVYNCTESFRVRKDNEFKGFIYNAIKTPWPVKIRDVVYQYSVSQNKTTLEVTLNTMAVKGMVPDKGNVRMTYMKSTFTLTPLDKNRIKIVLQNHSDPAGDVPQSVINMFIKDSPYYTLLNMRKLIESPTFKKKHNDNIKEM